MRQFSAMWVGLALLAPAVATAGSGFWSSTGPYGGRVVAMEIDPADAASIVVAAHRGTCRRAPERRLYASGYGMQRRTAYGGR